MKKYLTGLVFLIFLYSVCAGQSEPDSLLRKCMKATGANSKYLKDFRVQLGEGTSGNDYRYRVNLSMWKDTRYRFTMCTSDESKGQLILNIKDDLNRPILTSYDMKTETVYPYVEFECNKSGIYKLFYDFTGSKSGLGISIVSLVR
jgi:hypothetical protein